MDSPFSRMRTPGRYAYCNGVDRFDFVWNYNRIFDTDQSESVTVSVGVITATNGNTVTIGWAYRNTPIPSGALWGGGVETCESSLGGQGSAYGFSRVKYGNPQIGGGNRPLIFKVDLHDVPPLGQREYRFYRSSVRDIAHKGAPGPNCSLYGGTVTDGSNSYVNNDRTRLFICTNVTVPSTPPAQSTHYIKDLIQLSVDTQDPVPQCLATWCNPDAATYPTGVPVSQTTYPTYYPVGLGVPLSYFAQPGSSFKFISNNTNLVDFSADASVVPQATATPTPGALLFSYGGYVPAYINYSNAICGQPNLATVTAQFLDPSGNVMCQCDTAALNITCNPNPEPWWQVVNGDFIAAGGDVKSDVLATQPPLRKFVTSSNLGMPIFTGTLVKPVSVANLGTPGWKVRTVSNSHKTVEGGYYNYGYFANKFIPAADNLSATNGVINNAAYLTSNTGIPNPKDSDSTYRYYRRNGDVTIAGNLDFTPAAIGTRKIIIFVEGNLNINGKILLDNGQDFIMFIVKGNINIAGTVGDTPVDYISSTPDIEGIFITDEAFNTGAGVLQLHVRGIVVGFGHNGVNNGVNLLNQRDLGADNTFPAERFEYAPDLMLLFPHFYSEKSITWKEVAP